MGAGLLGSILGAPFGPLGRIVGSAIGSGLGQVITNKLQGRPWDEGLLFNVGLSVATEGVMMGAEQWARGGTAAYAARATEERGESSVQWKEYAFDGSDVEMELVPRKQKGGLPVGKQERTSVDPAMHEQLLENLKQNRLAREASGFSRWVETVERPALARAIMSDPTNFEGLGDLPPEIAMHFQRAAEDAQAPVAEVGGMAKQVHHNPVPDYDVYIEMQHRPKWTSKLKDKWFPSPTFDRRPLNDDVLWVMDKRTHPGLDEPYIYFAPGRRPVWVRKK